MVANTPVSLPRDGSQTESKSGPVISDQQHTHCGILNLNKPTGVSSRWVVNRVSRLVRGTRVGHAGTLDPLASGVLVVCLGAATRVIEFVQRMPKTYRTTVRL